jgi:ABC-type transport system involved in multi-copper enzyme maturation permease subunit
MELTNPILHRELRQGLLGRRFLVTQWVFVAALALIVWVAWPRETKLQVKQVELAEQLFHLFSTGLYLAVAALSAAFGAMTMTREKETGCFDLLCTTGLSVTQLLWGKLLSVVGFLLLLVVTSLPVTTVCYIMGGIEWDQIGRLYLHLAGAMLLFGWIGVTCSSFCERNQHALTAAFAVTLPLAVVCLAYPKWQLVIEAIVVVVLLFLLEDVAERVRRPREAHQLPDQPGTSITITMDADSPLDRLLIPHRDQKPFSDHKNPVYERELIEESEAAGRPWWHFLLRFTILLAVVGTIGMFFGRLWLEGQVSSTAEFERKLAEYADYAQLRLFDYVILVALLIAPAQSASAFSKERERQTADLLLTTLLRPREIVLGKWRLGLKTSFHLLVLLSLPWIAVVVLICFGKNASVPVLTLQAVAGFVIAVATLVTLNTLSVFCSLLCRSTAQALSASLAIAVGWFGGPVLLYQLLTRFSELPVAAYAWLTHVTPFPSFYAIAGSKTFEKAAASLPAPLLAAEYLLLTVAVNVVLLAAMTLAFDRFWRRV